MKSRLPGDFCKENIAPPTEGSSSYGAGGTESSSIGGRRRLGTRNGCEHNRVAGNPRVRGCPGRSGRELSGQRNQGVEPITLILKSQAPFAQQQGNTNRHLGEAEREERMRRNNIISPSKPIDGPVHCVVSCISCRDGPSQFCPRRS